jgi:hypothetical protein
MGCDGDIRVLEGERHDTFLVLVVNQVSIWRASHDRVGPLLHFGEGISARRDVRAGRGHDLELEVRFCVWMAGDGVEVEFWW